MSPVPQKLGPRRMIRLPEVLARELDEYRASKRPIPQPGIVIRMALAQFLRREREAVK